MAKYFGRPVLDKCEELRTTFEQHAMAKYFGRPVLDKRANQS